MDVKEILAYVCFAGLDDSPATEALELKSRPPPGLLNAILPLNLSQKAEKIGQQIQYRHRSAPNSVSGAEVTYEC